MTAASNATTGLLTLTAADGRDIAITAPPVSGAVLAATQQTNFLANTGLAAASIGFGNSTATIPVLTGGVVSGVTTTAAVGTFTVDGKTLFTNTIAAGATGTLITPANLDTAWTTFAASNAGYSLTGTFAAGTAVITKADGTAITLAATSSGGAGGAISAFAGGGLGTTAALASTALGDTHGRVTLSSTSASGIVLSGGNPALAGFTAGTTAATTVSSVSAISAVDISTAAGASSALTAIDGAIATINSSRASLGAYQNRFASVVSSLQTTTENLTASRSRIQDTDFAAETSALSRAQILQQAGTAMLAQANQLPNQVMTLLR